MVCVYLILQETAELWLASGLYFIPFIYVSMPLPTALYRDYCSFNESLEIV